MICDKSCKVVVKAIQDVPVPIAYVAVKVSIDNPLAYMSLTHEWYSFTAKKKAPSA